MSRRRYLSTDISTDARINRLAQHSEFAALLYTWMIPHAADDGTLTGDPDELLLTVVPGLRRRTAEDVTDAVGAMETLGLVEWDRESGRIWVNLGLWDERGRDPRLHAAWRKAVLRRDEHTCRQCGVHRKLHAHHVRCWAAYPDERLSVDNGLTLCKDCHREMHRKAGPHGA